MLLKVPQSEEMRIIEETELFIYIRGFESCCNKDRKKINMFPNVRKPSDMFVLPTKNWREK